LKKTLRGQGPPFVSGDRNFTFAARKSDFPFEKVADDSLLLRFAPIELRWDKHRRNRSVDGVEHVLRAGFGEEKEQGQF
jgi:hypothetical protein